MSFKEILAALRRSACDEVPAPQMAVLQKASLLLRKSGILDRCLQKGETAPDFAIEVANGENQQLYDLLEEGPVVLNFYRGSWCAFCRAELKAFDAIRPQLQELGATCLAISPEVQAETQTAGGLRPFPEGMLVHDQDNNIARAFGILYTVNREFQDTLHGWGLNLPALHNTDRWELPLAATYIIGPDRTVVFSYVEVDFRKRFDPSMVLEQLRA